MNKKCDELIAFLVSETKKLYQLSDYFNNIDQKEFYESVVYICQNNRELDMYHAIMIEIQYQMSLIEIDTTNIFSELKRVYDLHISNVSLIHELFQLFNIKKKSFNDRVDVAGREVFFNYMKKYNDIIDPLIKKMFNTYHFELKGDQQIPIEYLNYISILIDMDKYVDYYLVDYKFELRKYFQNVKINAKGIVYFQHILRRIRKEQARFDNVPQYVLRSFPKDSRRSVSTIQHVKDRVISRLKIRTTIFDDCIRNTKRQIELIIDQLCISLKELDKFTHIELLDDDSFYTKDELKQEVLKFCENYKEINIPFTTKLHRKFILMLKPTPNPYASKEKKKPIIKDDDPIDGFEENLKKNYPKTLPKVEFLDDDDNNGMSIQMITKSSYVGVH